MKSGDTSEKASPLLSPFIIILIPQFYVILREPFAAVILILRKVKGKYLTQLRINFVPEESLRSYIDPPIASITNEIDLKLEW